MGMGFDWEDFQWAVSVLLSRSFVVGSPSRHLVVPGVDMANHSPRSNAEGRYTQFPITSPPPTPGLYLLPFLPGPRFSRQQ